MDTLVDTQAVKRLTAEELDSIAGKLEVLDLERSSLYEKLKEQVRFHGFTPERAKKSRRLLGNLFSFTLSGSSHTEIKDSEVEKIRTACPRHIFEQLFCPKVSYSLAGGVLKLLGGTLPTDAPRNLRQLFNRAVITTEVLVLDPKARLVIKSLGDEAA